MYKYIRSIYKLYINKVNFNFRIITSEGAQFSCIGYESAKNLKADYLIDKTFTGEATGVGKQGIIGKIHLLEFEIQKNIYKM